PGLLEIEALVNGRGGARQERLQQYRDAPQLLDKVVQDALGGVFVGLDQLPRLGLVRVAVGRIENLPPDALQRLVVLATLDVRLNLLDGGLRVGLAVDFTRFDAGGTVQRAAVILGDERHDAAVEIAEI